MRKFLDTRAQKPVAAVLSAFLVLVALVGVTASSAEASSSTSCQTAYKSSKLEVTHGGFGPFPNPGTVTIGYHRASLRFCGDVDDGTFSSANVSTNYFDRESLVASLYGTVEEETDGATRRATTWAQAKLTLEFGFGPLKTKRRDRIEWSCRSYKFGANYIPGCTSEVSGWYSV